MIFSQIQKNRLSPQQSKTLQNSIFLTCAFVFEFAFAVLFLALPLHVFAQTNYPNKPIKITVPFGAGSSPDVVARLLGESMSKELGQPIVIENKAGASTIIGAQAVATSAADGYSLLYTVNNTTSINPYVYKQLPYKPEDFVPVVHVLNVPYVLVTSAQSPYKSLNELLSAAKAQPGQLNYGSYGIAQGTHVAMARMLNEAGATMTHVPYKDSPIPDTIAGTIAVVFEPTTTAIPQIKGGKIRALAVSGSQRVDALSNIPTVGETLPGFVGDSWHGILAPKGTPNDVVNRLNAVAQKIIASEGFQSRLREFGLKPVGGPPAAFQRFLVDDAKAWSKVVSANNIRVE